MQNNKLEYHFNQFISELKAQITEEVVTSVKQVLREENELNNGHSRADQFLTCDEVASLFKISKSQIHKLRRKHSKFPVIKIGSAVRYKQSELELFFNQISNKKVKK